MVLLDGAEGESLLALGLLTGLLLGGLEVVGASSVVEEEASSLGAIVLVPPFLGSNTGRITIPKIYKNTRKSSFGRPSWDICLIKYVRRHSSISSYIIPISECLHSNSWLNT